MEKMDSLLRHSLSVLSPESGTLDQLCSLFRQVTARRKIPDLRGQFGHNHTPWCLAISHFRSGWNARKDRRALSSRKRDDACSRRAAQNGWNAGARMPCLTERIHRSHKLSDWEFLRKRAVATWTRLKSFLP